MVDLKLIVGEEKPMVDPEGNLIASRRITFICEVDREQRLAIAKDSSKGILKVHIKQE